VQLQSPTVPALITADLRPTAPSLRAQICKSLIARLCASTGGHHGLNDTSHHHRTYIGSRRWRFLWPGALVLNCYSVAERGLTIDLEPRRLALAAGDFHLPFLTIPGATRRGHQAPGGTRRHSPIHAALAVSFRLSEWSPSVAAPSLIACLSPSAAKHG